MTESESTTNAKNLRTYHILLAEASAADVGIVCMTVRDEDFDHVLYVAKDGAEALNYILQADPDLKAPELDPLLLDMSLPKYDGEESLKCMRSTEHCGQIPVVVISSSDAAPSDQYKAQEDAALIYFRKPSRVAEFIELGEIVDDIVTCRQPRPANANAENEEVA